MTPARLVPWLVPPLLFGVWLAAAGWKTLTGWVILAVLGAVSGVVVTLEVATLRKWGGWWGEKDPDGSSRWD